MSEEKENSSPRERKPRKKLDPQTNILQISAKSSVNFYTFLSKIFLKKYENIELHALGRSVSICARLAERLDRFELGKMVSIQTETFLS